MLWAKLERSRSSWLSEANNRRNSELPKDINSEELFTMGQAKVTQESVLKQLYEAFPTHAFGGASLRLNDESQRTRLACELGVAGIDQVDFMEVSLQTARGTVDILELLHPQELPIVLPGYLKWLVDIDSADILINQTSTILASSLEKEQGLFSLQQLQALYSLFGYVHMQLATVRPMDNHNRVSSVMALIAREVSDLQGSPTESGRAEQ
jgi:hypothetical protein